MSFTPDKEGFAETARCPVQFRGDWNSVLENDAVEVVASGFQWTEGG